MKKLLLCLLVLAFSHSIMAQIYVSTTPQNKKAILEEFTGTGCPNCPGGHTTAASILTANSGNVFVIANHPTNSNYTASDPMKNPFPNAFYTNPFIAPVNRYMPSAMISRRVWGGVERIQGTTYWAADVTTIMGEPSPLNVGLSSVYDPSTHMLTVNVEVYYTADVTDPLTIYTMITEDGIIAAQSGGTSPYTHNHVFRAALPQPGPQQWGEVITGATTATSLTSLTYTYDNTSTNYNMNECEVVVFVRNAANEEIISGNGAKAGMSTSVNNLVSEAATCSVYPNPVNNNSSLHFSINEPNTVSYTLTDAIGNVIKQEKLGRMDAGQHQVNLDTESLSNGLYFITLFNGRKTNNIKFIK